MSTLQPRQPLTDADWETIIGVIREHRIVRVSANGFMTDAALDKLSHLPHVTGLALGGSRQLTDDGLMHLARMPQLEKLDLSEYPGGRLTDRGLEVLRHLPHLAAFRDDLAERDHGRGRRQSALLRSARAREPDGHRRPAMAPSGAAGKARTCGTSTPAGS